MAARPLLRIGFVPEHFSTPLHFARKHFQLQADLVPFPSGTGHMVSSLRSREIDVGIGLTEGWIAGLGRKRDPSTESAVQQAESGGYKLLGTYVESPLCWAISTGLDRREITGVQDVRGRKIGISRRGSGSHVMGYVLAEQRGWLSSPSSSESAAAAAAAPFEIHPLQTFASLRQAVNDGTADFFMWEYFTSKRYYSPRAQHPLKQLGEIYTPWPSWHIVSRLEHSAEAPEPRVEDFLGKLNRGIEYFRRTPEEAVEYISTELDYEEEDARKWLETVRFADDVRGVRPSVVSKTIEVLVKAGVLVGEDDGGRGMVGVLKAEES